MKKIILGAALCGLLAAGCSLDKSYLNGPNALTFPASKAEVEAGVFAAYKGLTLIDASSTPFPGIQDNASDIGASRLNAANYNYQQQSNFPPTTHGSKRSTTTSTRPRPAPTSCSTASTRCAI